MTIDSEFDRPAKEIEREVAGMISAWERGDDLPSDLAARLVVYFRSLFAKSKANSVV